MITAPEAPGALGKAAEPRQLLVYLEELGTWLTALRQQLGEIDQLARDADKSQELYPDIRLGMSLWQAITNRFQLLLTTWDSGRVGARELEMLSSQIWGRLDAGPVGPRTTDLQGMSLPEACRLSDALVGQLRQRLGLGTAEAQTQTRLRDLVAQVERLREQVKLEPPSTLLSAQTRLSSIEKHLKELEETSSRGGDIGGLLGAIEVDAATFERDMIVNGVKRREQALSSEKAVAERDQLIARAAKLRDLVAFVAGRVSPAPRYAVPDVVALGAVPGAQNVLASYTEQLAQVKRALDHVEAANLGALDAIEALKRDRAELTAPNSNSPRAELLKVLDELITTEPLPLAAAQSLIAAIQHLAEYEKPL